MDWSSILPRDFSLYCALYGVHFLGLADLMLFCVGVYDSAGKRKRSACFYTEHMPPSTYVMFYVCLHWHFDLGGKRIF